MLARGPLFIQPLQMDLERTLPDAEDVGALTAKNLADQSATVSGATDDFFDFGAAFGPSEDDVVDLFPSEVSFVLKAFSRSGSLGLIVAAPMAVRT